jgi:hypothetical protein
MGDEHDLIGVGALHVLDRRGNERVECDLGHRGQSAAAPG